MQTAVLKNSKKLTACAIMITIMLLIIISKITFNWTFYKPATTNRLDLPSTRPSTPPIKVCQYPRNASFEIKRRVVTWGIIEHENKNVQNGGRYKPRNCASSSPWRVAVLVPYKDKGENLKVFLRNIHQFLQRQNHNYGIFVLEMPFTTSINRGLLWNAGFKEITKSYDYNCFIFHDMDVLPENIENVYECSDNPIHMSFDIDTGNYTQSHGKNLERVVKFTKDQFILINGFSNVHLNTESHFYYRTKMANLTIKRLSPEFGRYKDLGHKPSSLPQDNDQIDISSLQMNLSDGLSNLTYKTARHDFRRLYTRILIGMNYSTNQTDNRTEHADAQHEPTDGFYSYVTAKGITIKNLAQDRYRISYKNWTCDVNASIAKSFEKKHVSWTDMLETRISVLEKRTPFSASTLRRKLGVLPKEGTPVTLVARQNDFKIPKENVIIRLNNHGPLDARTTMIATWDWHVRSLTLCSREQTTDEIITWWHNKPRCNGAYYRRWNTSYPLLVPESAWNTENLIYYRGPLYFMKGHFNFFGQFSECVPVDGIGLGAINRFAHLKGDVTTLGYSTDITDYYNVAFRNRFALFVHKLVWSYFVVEELTDTL